MVMLVGGRDDNSPSMDLISSKIVQHFIHLLQRYCAYNSLNNFLFKMHVRASVSLIPQKRFRILTFAKRSRTSTKCSLVP